MAPTEWLVIADAGPLIHLDELASFDILADFGTVIVPDAVWREVERHRPNALEQLEKPRTSTNSLKKQ